MPLKPALGADDGVLVGPGRGLQLSSTAHGKAGRLLFCGHKADTFSGRLSPIWRPALSTYATVCVGRCVLLWCTWRAVGGGSSRL